jgi:hypothetical protein
MAKLKPAKGKSNVVPPVRGGLPCVVLVILMVIAVGVLLFLVMKYAG